MKKLLLTLLSCSIWAGSVFCQVTYKIQLLPDNQTYRISMIPAVNWSFPNNITASGQVTIRMPHGLGNNSFQVADLTMLTPDADWVDNARVNAPVEAPAWDYISFGLISSATTAYVYQAGVEIPLFSFRNGSPHCADSIEIISNLNDPFLPPNSSNANVGNALLTLGGGLDNAYTGNFGSGKVPCTPGTICTKNTALNILLCDGEAYLDSVYTQSVFLDEHFTTADGCDSVIGTTIVVAESTYFVIDTAICQGELFNGSPLTQDISTTTVLTNSQGCDSVVTYFVDMVEPVHSTSSVTLLSGQIFNGIAWTSDTTLVFAATGTNGCDSFSTVHILMYQVPVTVQSFDLCQGELFNGVAYQQSTSLVDTVSNWQGFDSIVLTNLFVHPSWHVEQTVAVCQGQPFNGMIYQDDVELTQNLSTAFGCDSTIVTHLDVIVPVSVSFDTTICEGETYLGWQVPGDTVVTSIYLSAGGCDSLILTANLHVTQPPVASITGETNLCAGETTTLTATGGTNFWWSNGKTSNSIEVSSSGKYSVTVTSSSGCEAVTAAQVFVSNLTAQAEIILPSCQVGSDGKIIFSSVSGGTAPYFFSVDGGNLFTSHASFHNLLPGVYEAIIEDKNGCQWSQSLAISDPDNLLLELGDDQLIRLGESVVLEAATNISQPVLVQWSPAKGLSCTDCLEPTASPVESTTYRLTITDQSGCSVTDKIRIVVQTDRRIFVPTAFSPNGDGINDRLFLFAGKDVAAVRRFVVLDRWGELLFSAENAAPNDPSFGWDGSFRGKEMATAVYSWLAEVEFVDGMVERFSGETAVLK